MDSLITLKNVSKHYGQGHQRTDVLKEINLDIREGEFVAIVGYSGAGKTTLISLIAGLLKPSSGQVLQKGDPITEPDPSRALVFQNYSLSFRAISLDLHQLNYCSSHLAYIPTPLTLCLLNYLSTLVRFPWFWDP